MPRRRFRWPLVALAALLAAGLAGTAEFGRRLEFQFADSGAERLLHEIASDVVIVAIDAKSLAALNEWPWPRRHHAALIARLASAEPARVFFDIDFSSPSNPDDDGRLESALAAWPGAPIVLPAFYQYAPQGDDELILTRPLPRFRPHTALASVNLRPSIDGLVRRVPRSVTDGARPLPSVAALLNPSTADRQADIPVDYTTDYTIDYTIDPSSFPVFSYSDVLANRVPAEYFAGKTVFVGATAIELGDMIPVPVHQALPGVVVQAIAYESARRGGYGELAPSIYWLLVAGWTFLLAFWFCRLSWRRNVALLFAALASAVSASLLVYVAARAIVPVVPPGIASIAAYLLATLRSLESETLRALAYAVGLRRRDALLKSIVLSSTDSIVCVDGAGVIKTANPAAARLFHSPVNSLPGTSIFALLPSLPTGTGGNPEPFADRLHTVTECLGRTTGGEEFPVELSFSRVRLKEEELYTAIIRDVSERKAQQRQLQFQATHDPLTTLPNRPALAAHLDSLLARCAEGDRLALLMVDLNRFKEVNDTLGHNVGDYVLYEVARRLEDAARGRGFIARIGGDEFALVVEDCGDRTELSALSAALADCLKKPIETCGVAIDVGMSIGISVYPDDARDAEALFKNSDVAMYVAKRGATSCEYYDSANDGHSVRKLTIVTRLRQAIANHGLRLHYQPKVNLASGRVDSAEALVRWQDEELGVVSPDEFIPLAEATDLIHPLSAWTLATALRQSACWQADGLDLRVAVNLSARLLQDAGFPARFSAMMRDQGVPPDRIEVEITESAMMADPERAMRIIDELYRLGVCISIDDYGTGYSSLAYLRDLPAYALKLDKSFVTSMRERDDNRIIVASTAQMAHAMNLKVVAEGVETAEDAAMLRDLGYDFAQGYWYSAALPADAFTSWVRRFNRASLHDFSDRARAAG